jgi:hypothetical protein
MGKVPLERSWGSSARSPDMFSELIFRFQSSFSASKRNRALRRKRKRAMRNNNFWQIPGKRQKSLNMRALLSSFLERELGAPLRPQPPAAWWTKFGGKAHGISLKQQASLSE